MLNPYGQPPSVILRKSTWSKNLSLQAHILVVDDDPEIGQLLQDYLEKYEYRVSVAEDGKAMRMVLEGGSVDLIILDVMLPDEDGISLCRQLRQNSPVPVMMLSAAGEETDRIVGLEVGADDYLTKPFSPRELLARVKALLRRSQGPLAQKRRKQQRAQMSKLAFDDWTLDRQKQELVDSEGLIVPLSRGEYTLLVAFIESAGRVLSRDGLLDLTQGRDASPFDRSIDVQVGRLRKKIEKDPKDPNIILTVRGGGYRFASKVKEL